jgi:hypothetical protein
MVVVALGEPGTPLVCWACGEVFRNCITPRIVA